MYEVRSLCSYSMLKFLRPFAVHTHPRAFLAPRVVLFSCSYMLLGILTVPAPSALFSFIRT